MHLLILATAIFTSTFSDTSSAKLDSFSKEKSNIYIGKININNQPEWGPSGYEYVEYYYIPDIETYYSVATHQYIYYRDFRWNFSSLPPKYREVDIYNCYKVVINEPKPFLRFNEHKEAYAQYKGLKEKQVCIKNCTDEKFRNCWKNCNSKVEAWEACTDKKIRKNLKKEADVTEKNIGASTVHLH